MIDRWIKEKNPPDGRIFLLRAGARCSMMDRNIYIGVLTG